jgi:hypothetical protein
MLRRAVEATILPFARANGIGVDLLPKNSAKENWSSLVI